MLFNFGLSQKRKSSQLLYQPHHLGHFPVMAKTAPERFKHFGADMATSKRKIGSKQESLATKGSYRPLRDPIGH